jgi:hypothetical protein
MGFWRNLMDSMDELREINAQFRQEMGELFTDGFTEIVFKGNTEWKDSYEREAEAARLIEGATGDYQEMRDALEKEIRNTDRALARLGKFKVDIQATTIARWLKAIWVFQPVTYNEKSFGREKVYDFLADDSLDEIKARSVDSVRIGGMSARAKTIEALNISVALCGLPARPGSLLTAAGTVAAQAWLPTVGALSPIAIGVSVVRSIDWDRIRRAQGYLDDARTYRATVDVHLAKIRHCIATLKYINKRVREITRTLKALDHWLAEETDTLFDLNRARLTSKDENRIMNTVQMVRAINTVSALRIVNDKGFPDKASERVYERVCQLVKEVTEEEEG